MNVPTIEESLRQSILDHNMEVLYYLTMQPGNMIELGLAIFIGIMVLTFAISKIHILGKNGAASLLLTLFVVIISSFCLIEVASFTKLWLIPKTGISQAEGVLVACAVGAAFLFMVVPFTRFLLKSGYFISMSAWILGLIIMLAAMFLFSRTYDEPRSGETPIDTLESIREQAEENEVEVSLPEYE